MPNHGTTALESTTPEAAIRRRVDSLAWYHSIDVGCGVVTKGLTQSAPLDDYMPDFEGKTVLDIGAWDGYYSFLAERLGASRVVALDHYVWGVDFGAREAYWRACAQNGRLPDHRRDVVDFWRPDLPGKAGFDLARELLGSKVESLVADFATIDLAELGTFDIVIYCGVLYHMKDPLSCLERVRSVTRQVAVVATEAVHIPGREGTPLAEFLAGDEINDDFGNWWMPNMTALRAMCRAAGFSSTSIQVGPTTRGSSGFGAGDPRSTLDRLKGIGRTMASCVLRGGPVLTRFFQ